MREDYDARSKTIALTITNLAAQVTTVRARNRYTSRGTEFVLGPGEQTSHAWLLKSSSGWYDLTLTVEESAHLVRRVAGHLEDGDDSISDPLMGGLV